MKRWIKILIIVPVMLTLSQCVYRPFNSGYVDGHVTGYVEGFVYDASDGHLLSNVHVEIRIRREHTGLRVMWVRPNRRHRRCTDSYRHTMVFDVYTDHEGFFAYEFPLYDSYSYSLVLSAGDYCARRMRIDNPRGQYLEIALSPH